MPATTVYAKGAQDFAATVANGFLNFSYLVVDNYSDQTSSGDSTTAYSYFFPADAVSLKLIINTVSGSSELFELSYQNVQISFSAGEYYDIANGATLDVGGVYSLIVGALSI